MSRRRRLASIAVLVFALFGPGHAADEPEPAAPTAPPRDVLFFGFETDPAMDAGGRTVASIQKGFGLLMDRWAKGSRRPGIRPAWEFPSALVLSLVQHEILGHGARGREFGLNPTYGFGWDLSAYTSIDIPPSTHDQEQALAAGGTESSSVAARRLLVEAHRSGGTYGAAVPFLLISKLDLTLYVLLTDKPDANDSGAEDDFIDQYRTGNDMAVYLTGRQGARAGVDVADVWNRVYVPDTSDPRLQSDYRDLRLAALWNLLDPALVGAMVEYFRDHVLDDDPTVEGWMLDAGRGVRLSMTTRSILAPNALSHYLEMLVRTPRGLATVYVRDLDSGIDRTWGAGAGLHAIRFGEVASLGFDTDFWREPRSLESTREGSGWCVSAEAEITPSRHWGFAVSAGTKSEGFLPGRPLDEGGFFGLGLVYRP